MPPVPKIDLGIVLFDLAASNKTELLNGLLKFATFKWFSNSQSLYKLILFNSSETKNSKKIPNIYEIKNKDFDPKFLVEIIESIPPGDGANWLDALKLGIKHLEAASDAKGVITLQLIFFTSLKFPSVPTDEAEIESIITKLNSNYIYLYFIGPDIQLPYPITDKSSIVKCMEELNVDASDTNLVLAHKIVSNSGGVICNTKIGVPHLLITYKNFPGTQPWKVPLAFGTNLSIPASTYRIYRKDLCLKLQQNINRRYIKTLADDPEVIVPESDIIKGIVRHGKFIKIDDNAQFKLETKRCFDVIGFTDKINIPETYMSSEYTFYILPNETKNNFNIFTHLVKILHEEEKYGIVKRVYATNTRQQYFVLIAKVDFEPKCLIMTGLVGDEFILPHKFENPSKIIKPEEDDFQRFFNSLIIENRDNRAGITLGPTMMMDIYQQKFINAAANKYTKRENFDMDSLNVCDFESVPNNNFLDDLGAIWPIRDINTT